ncbi:hypothetical protein FHX37_3846 [Haloactinospora alba]|uniref:VOC domain-containing protein n=1 Tax=Haloactinospora alba TaxID=405555 RepID=A0A543N9L4_9ACTN|nr:VOC family protein [Haloactinospora alba]TQN28501.1 hypothetical protein FHX37_3846 [Haloactinospora alba]
MPTLGNLSVTIVHCENYAEMVAFYRDRLGFPVLEEHPQATVLRTGNGGELVFSGQEDEPPFRLGFTDTDVEAARADLSDLSPSELRPHKNGRGFTAWDPEGNTLEFVDD